MVHGTSGPSVTHCFDSYGNYTLCSCLSAVSLHRFVDAPESSLLFDGLSSSSSSTHMRCAVATVV